MVHYINISRSNYVHNLWKKKCYPVSILNLFFELQSHVYMVYVLYSFSVYLQEPFFYEQGGCYSGLLIEKSEHEPYILDATDGYQFWNQASLILQASLGFCRWFLFPGTSEPEHTINPNFIHIFSLSWMLFV